MSSSGQAPLSQALNRLWAQFLPQMRERIDALEAANVALAAGELSIDQRAAANSAAHKLAGVLGTFGLTKGTVLAREAEMIYSEDLDQDPSAMARLAAIATQLRAIVESRS